MNTAIITGADGGMGIEITRAVALEGYHVIMVCLDKTKAEKKVKDESIEGDISIKQCDLSSVSQVEALCRSLLSELTSIDLLMNNAGTMCTHFSRTPEGFEETVAVNYLAPFILCLRLSPIMHRGSRIVNMVSCTYAIGHVGPHFFSNGSESRIFWRIPVYSNTKYALWMLTFELSNRLKDKGISVNAADPGVVSTDIIRMHAWFDPLTDIFFRPFIRKPRKGADTAIRLLLDLNKQAITGCMFYSGRQRTLKPQYTDRKLSGQLWDSTQRALDSIVLTTSPS